MSEVVDKAVDAYLRKRNKRAPVSNEIVRNEMQEVHSYSSSIEGFKSLGKPRLKYHIEAFIMRSYLIVCVIGYTFAIIYLSMLVLDSIRR